MAGLGDGDMVAHEEEGEEGLDLDRGLWAGVEAGEGGAAAAGGGPADVDVMAAGCCACELEEVQAVWDGCLVAPSRSGCEAVVEGAQTVDESGAVVQPISSPSAAPLGGESGKR